MTNFQKDVMRVVCSNCAISDSLSLINWRCPHCGGAWEPSSNGEISVNNICAEERGLWRYRNWMGISIEEPISLGAGGTPLLSASIQGRDVLLKTEYINPSGSFKDRGTEVMINVLNKLGARSLVEDSSGNAGASLAAYAARAGILVEIYAPENASPLKLAQIEMYGARINLVSGAREKASLAVKMEIENGAVYASHTWHPAFLLGQQSTAWEVWEQLDYRAPDVWVAPVGQGGHFLGIWMGFKRLFENGLVKKIPRMVAVQSASVAPIHKIFVKNLTDLPKMDQMQKTIAEGVVVTKPVRWKRIKHALQESNGFTIAIKEEDILPAREALAQSGFLVEPTSALATASLPEVLQKTSPTDTIVISLTGSGLKVPMIKS